MRKNLTHILASVLFVLIFASSSIAQQSFEFRYMNSSFSAFALQPETNSIFAGDEAGLIKRSDDKGKTWRLVSYQSESRINNIAFVNKDKGFAAVGQGGLILITDDAGKTWKRKQFRDTLDPQQAYRWPVKRVIPMDDQTIFFDVFNHAISAPSPSEVIVTRDGGLTFQLEYCPGNIFRASGDTLLAFGKEVVSFVYKLTIYRSVDKGRTWTIVKKAPAGVTNDFNNHGMEKAFFLNSQTFYITAHATLGSTTGIYKTTDGGQTFTAIASPGGKATFIHFKNTMEGMIFIPKSGPSTAYYTVNGGTNWTSSATNAIAPGLVLGANEVLAQVNGLAAISTDGVKTWSILSDPIHTIASGVPAGHYIRTLNDSVSFVSIGGNLVKTIDRGMTWKNIKIKNDFLTTGMPYHFLTPDSFFFCGSGYKSPGQGGYLKIRFTADGGETYTDKFTGEYQENPIDIVFIDKKHGVTYSNYAGTNFTSDGGETWKKTIPSPILGELVNMAFPSVNCWYALTKAGNVYKSIDTGKTYLNITGTITASGVCTGGVYFTSATTGFVHGCKGKVYQTTDGGTTWVANTNVPSTFQYRATQYLGFRNSTIGYFSDPSSGSAYQTAKTTDGGNTWSWYSAAQVNSIVRISFLNENTGVMLNQSGAYGRYVGDLKIVTDTMELKRGTAIGIEDLKHSETIQVYPNPVSNLLHIQSVENVISLNMFDLTGRNVYADNKRNDLKNSFEVAVNHLKAGVYFIQIETYSGRYTKKIVVE